MLTVPFAENKQTLSDVILKAVNYSENAHLLSNGKRAVHNSWDYLERNACALLHLLNPSHYVFKPLFLQHAILNGKVYTLKCMRCLCVCANVYFCSVLYMHCRENVSV